MSFNKEKLEKRAFNIFFKDSTLLTDLNGLSTLSVLKDFKFYSPKASDTKDIKTIKKSRMFQLSLKYAFFYIINLKLNLNPSPNIFKSISTT